VTVAAPHPEKVDGDAVLSILPEGRRRITVVRGGLEFPTEETVGEAKTHGVVVANACIVVLIDVDKTKRK
jgi:hypothetical protein